MDQPWKSLPSKGTFSGQEKRAYTPKPQSTQHRNVTSLVHESTTSPTIAAVAIHQGKAKGDYVTTGCISQPARASEPPPFPNLQNREITTKARVKSATGTSARRSAKPQCPTNSQKTTQGSKEPSSLHAPEKSATPHVSKQLSVEDITKIEKKTRGQRENPHWHSWRQNRITASMAHQISHSRFANQQSEEIPRSYLKAVLGTGAKVQTAAMTWGIRNEKRVVQVFERLASMQEGRQIKVEDCGLFIHPVKTWLAASPDGLVKDGQTGEILGLLEVKCPYKHRDHTVGEACTDRNFCLRMDRDSYTLRKDHAYYTQVQCQLAATNLSSAYFVVYTKKETAITNVRFEPEFWKKTEPKLERFYLKAVLPSIKKGPEDDRGIMEKAVKVAEE